MRGQRTSVGLDVHARSEVGCGLDGQTEELFERRLTPAHGCRCARNSPGSWSRNSPRGALRCQVYSMPVGVVESPRPGRLRGR